MRRVVLVGAALCIVASAPAAQAAKALMPPPPRSDDVADDVKWERDNLDVSDWLRLSIGDRSMRYATAAGMERLPGRDLRIWVRGEFYNPNTTNGNVARSALTLTEYDCDQRRYREMAEDSYPYNNLQGPKHSQDVQDPQWQYARPGTVGALEMTSVCELIDSIDAEAAAKAAKGQALPQGDATWRTVPPQK